MTANHSRLIALLSAIVVAAALRLVPHPPNFTPIGAMALFSGAYLGRRGAGLRRAARRACCSATPCSASIAAWTSVYLSVALIVVIGWLALAARLAAAGRRGRIASSVSFFVVTNFGMWLFSGIYPRTLAGLAACYVAAIPFFQNTLAGDLFYATLLFGGFAHCRACSCRGSAQGQAAGRLTALGCNFRRSPCRGAAQLVAAGRKPAANPRKNQMKSGTHPDYHMINVEMTDGTKFQTRSTWGKEGDTLHLDIDPKVHPAWTGGNPPAARHGGQVARFNKRFGGLSPRQEVSRLDPRTIVRGSRPSGSSCAHWRKDDFRPYHAIVQRSRGPPAFRRRTDRPPRIAGAGCWRPSAAGNCNGFGHLGGRAQVGRQAGRQCRLLHRLARP